MKTIHEIDKNKKLFNQIRSSMALQGLTVRKWAMSNNEPYTLVYQVATGTANRLQSPLTRCFKIQQMLKADGFWPVDEEQTQ